MIRAGSQPVVRVDITFRAGAWWQSKPLVASSANALMSEGTTKKSSREIAEALDYHGAYLNTSSDRDNAFLSVIFLTRHMDTILPLLAEIIKKPAFPREEYLSYRDRRKQNFLIEKSKVSNLAREMFALALYGPDHPYGRSISLSDFDKLDRNDLETFHSRYYRAGNCKIIASGNFDETKLTARMDELFGNDLDSPEIPAVTRAVKKSFSEKQIFVPRKDAVQSALRIGRETIGKSHPDYPGMLVLNNLLGGHFGARLMQNIREKKGYTYGIVSAMASLRNSGFFVIVSEVGNSYRENTVKEVYRELTRICTKPVSKKELDLTRTQMLGEIMREFDGPFARAESIRNLAEHDLDTGFYKKVISVITEISPGGLLELAVKYLTPDSMYEVVAGRK